MQPAFFMTPVDQSFISLSEDTAKQLTQAILDLNETLKKQVNNKNIYDDELWMLEHIAEHCHLSVPSIRKMVAKPTFPAPITPLSELGSKLWEQTDVKKWLIQNKSKLPIKRTKK